MTEQEKMNNRKQAIRKLLTLGKLKSFDSMAHLYHGNYIADKDNFFFDPYYKEAVGFYMLNDGAGFYAAENKDYINTLMTKRKDNARIQEKMQETANKNNAVLKDNYAVHEILASSPDSLVFNSNIQGWRLEDSESQYVFAEFAATFDFTSVCPLLFDEFQDKKSRAGIVAAIQDWVSVDNKQEFNTPFTVENLEKFDEAVDFLQNKYGMAEDLAVKYAAKFSIYGSFLKGDFPAVARTLLIDKVYLRIKSNKQGREDKAFNHCVECAKEIVSATNIVGTLDHTFAVKGENNYFFWSLDKVNTKSFIEKQIQRNQSRYGSITEQLKNAVAKKQVNVALTGTSPQDTIDFLVKQVPELKNFYNLNDGNWEGFSIGQHTESVLRVFEDSFSSEVPTAIIPFIKIMLALHDVGKGKSRAEFSRGSDEQKQAEMRYTADMINKVGAALGISSKNCDFMRFIIQDSQKYTTDYYIRHDVTALDRMNSECIKIYNKTFGHEPSHSDLVGIKSLATILQTCDSGAYSLKGISRDAKTGVYHFNGNEEFGQNMEKPMDIAKRKMHLKDPKNLDGRAM